MKSDLRSELDKTITTAVKELKLDELKTSVKLVENDVKNLREYVFRDLKREASTILKTPNPQIAYIKAKEEFKLADTFKEPKTAIDIAVTFSLVELRNDSATLKATVTSAKTGEPFKHLSGETKTIQLPEGTQKIIYYQLVHEGYKLPPIKLVVLQRPSSDALILAAAPEKQSSTS